MKLLVAAIGTFIAAVGGGRGNVPTLLFGLGAVAVAIHPDGQVAMNVRLVQGLVLQMIERRRHGPGGKPPGLSAAGGAPNVAEALETSA